jgi:transcriptional regulator with XRE-family HTH domain
MDTAGRGDEKSGDLLSSGVQQSAIKEVRKAKGWSYQDLGDRIGTSRGFIYKLENGENVTLSGERKRQLEELLEIEL